MLRHLRPAIFHRTLLFATALLTAASATVLAQTTLFFDDFDGPVLNPVFQASLPGVAPLGDGGGPCTYLGAPNHSFGTLGGPSVLRITNTMNNLQRRGWNTSTAFVATDFRYEARFNVLVQSPTTSIDSFIEAWLVDPDDAARYSIAGPHGGSYGLNRQFRAGARDDGPYSGASAFYSYTNDTWYRLVIQGLEGQNIRASLFADNGTTELVGTTLAYSTSAFAHGFQIGLAQATGVPNGAYPLDVAVDWVRLTTTAVPEPSTLALGILALAPLASRRLSIRSCRHFRS